MQIKGTTRNYFILNNGQNFINLTTLSVGKKTEKWKLYYFWEYSLLQLLCRTLWYSNKAKDI